MGQLCVLRPGGGDRVRAVFQHFCAGRPGGKSAAFGSLPGGGFFGRKGLRAYFGQLCGKWRNIFSKGAAWLLLASVLLFLLYAYGTSRGILHYDTALYHAQSIRWIEEYGIVKGLGNLHCRLAYNSASFALSALYSMAFLGGQSYHCAAGFLAFLLALVCLEAAEALGRFIWSSGGWT